MKIMLRRVKLLFFEEFSSNHAFLAALFAWMVAQILKVFTKFLFQKKWDFKRLAGSGGLPSSHSAFVMALSTNIGRQTGFNSTQYAIALAMGLIIMYDAAGVRRAAGTQAKIINKLIDDVYHQRPEFMKETLKELIGHTPFEVIAGAALGILIGGWFGF